MGRAMRVLMTADTLGGVFSYALDLCRALSAFDIEVVLATMGRTPTPEQRERAAEVPTLTLVDSTYKLEWMDDPWQDVTRSGGWLLDLERRYRPDVIHLNGYAHGGLPFRAPVVVVAHSCVLSWWSAVKGESAPARYRIYRDRVYAGLMHADAVVAPTAAMLAAVRRHYGRPGRSQVIANGCDTELFQPREKQPYVAAAGRMWDEAKNLQTLARAAGRMPWAVRVAGEAELPAGVSGDAAEQRSELTWLGQLPRPRLAELLGHASIYAFPARYEPFGLSVLEAAASGAALVLGDIPSLRELWDGAALFVPPDDDGALAASVAWLANNEAQRESFARRARLRAHQHDLARFGERYRELYLELLSQRARSRERGGTQVARLAGTAS